MDDRIKDLLRQDMEDREFSIMSDKEAEDDIMRMKTGEDLYDEIDALRATIEAKDAEIAGLEIRCENAESGATLHASMCNVNEMQDRIDALERELAAMTDRRDRAMLATEEAEARVRELEDLLNEANKLIMEHCDQADRIAKLERELAEARREWRDLALLIARSFDDECTDADWSDIVGTFDPWDCVKQSALKFAETKKDTARLDWLESRKTVGAGFLVLDGATCTEVRFEWDAIDGPSSLRAAIDDAKEEE